MKIELLGMTIVVPQRYPTYSDEQKSTVLRHVHLLQKKYGGDRLASVHVDRLVRRGHGFRVVGTFSYGGIGGAA